MSKSMVGKFEKPTVKQHLAAIRMLFDYLVVGQILAINPAHAVRGPKHSVKRGKTLVLSAAQARQPLDSIDVSTVVGLRDRALIALMTFSFARVGAAVGMRVEDYFADGKRWRLRLNEKGGKVHEMPAHHNLEAYLDAYMHVAGLFDAKGTPLFRSADWHGGALTNLPMHRVDVWRMIRRRAVLPASTLTCAAILFARPGSRIFSPTAARSKTPRRWPIMPARVRRSSTTAPATKSHSMRSNELRFDSHILASRLYEPRPGERPGGKPHLPRENWPMPRRRCKFVAT
jgi:integrase